MFHGTIRFAKFLGAAGVRVFYVFCISARLYLCRTSLIREKFCSGRKR